MDKNYHTTCPRVLYRASDDRQVFPKILLDQVDRKHVYVPFQNLVGELYMYKQSCERWRILNLQCRDLSHAFKVLLNVCVLF